MSPLLFILLASLQFGCHDIFGQTTEMVQTEGNTNITTHRQQTLHPITHLSTSDEHALHTSSPHRDTWKITTAASVESEISQLTTDLQHRSDYSQHAADQTSAQTQHTATNSPSASMQSQLTSEHSHHGVRSSTQHSVTVQRMVVNSGHSQTQIESSHGTVLIVTNSDEPASQSSSEHREISVMKQSSRFSQSERLYSSTNVFSTVEPRSLETDRRMTLTSSLKDSVTDVTFHDEGTIEAVHLQSSLTSNVYSMSHSHYVSEIFASVTPPLETTAVDNTVSTLMKEIVSGQISSSSSEVFQQSTVLSDVSRLASRTPQSGKLSQMFATHLNTTAIVTSPSTESIVRVPSSHVSESSEVFVIYSTNIQSDMASFSHSAAFYPNSTIFINAPAAGTGKPPVGESNYSRYYTSSLHSEMDKTQTSMLETSLQQVIHQSTARIVESEESQLIYSSVSSTEAGVLMSSYSTLTKVMDALSFYSESITPSVSKFINVTRTQQEQNTVFSNTTGESTGITRSSDVHSELTTSSMLHQDITPTSVYQSINTNFTSHTADVVSTVVMERTSSIKPDNISTTTPRILEIRDVRFLFVFRGDCHLIQNNSLLFGEFLLGLVNVLSKKLNIPKHKIKADNFSCGSLKIYVTLLKVPYHQVTNILKNLITSHSFTVKIFLQNNIATFDAFHIEEVKVLPGSSGIFDMPNDGLDEVDIIVIIVACCICGILLSIGGILCIKECYRRKYAQSFDLIEVPNVNLKLEDFTLTRIPRAKAIYNEDSVTMQSYTDNYGQHVAKGNEQQSKSNNGVHVRMNKNTDGIVIGIVGMSKGKNENNSGRKAKWCSSASLENSSGAANPSMENLLPSSSDSHTTEGAHNPIFVDDECASCSNDSYSKSS